MTATTDPTGGGSGIPADAPDSRIPLTAMLRQRLPGTFSDRDVNEIARLTYDELELRVGDRLAEGLGDAQILEFEALVDAEDGEGVERFLDIWCPDRGDVAREECDKMVDEVVRRVLNG
ncbi:MAG: DUF5663 domain-containing protein [Gordonia amarae]